MLAPWTCVYGDSPAAALFDFVADLGTVLITEFIGEILPILQNYFVGELLGDKVKELAEPVCSIFSVFAALEGIVNDIGDAVGGIADVVDGLVPPIFGDVVDDGLEEAIESVRGLVGPVNGAIDTIDILFGGRRRRALEASTPFEGFEDNTMKACSEHTQPCQDERHVCLQTVPQIQGVCVTKHDAARFNQGKISVDAVQLMHTTMIAHHLDTVDTRIQQALQNAFAGITEDNKSFAAIIVSSLIETEERTRTKTEQTASFLQDVIHEECAAGAAAKGPQSTEELMNHIRKSDPYKKAQEAATGKGMSSNELDQILDTFFSKMTDPNTKDAMNDQYIEGMKKSNMLDEIRELIVGAINQKEDDIVIQQATRVLREQFLDHGTSRRLVSFTELESQCNEFSVMVAGDVNSKLYWAVVGLELVPAVALSFFVGLLNHYFLLAATDLIDVVISGFLSFADGAPTPDFLKKTEDDLKAAKKNPVVSQLFLYKFIQMFDPFSENSLILIPFRTTIKVVQTIASIFLFGCSKTLNPTTCGAELPSQTNRHMEVSETRDGHIYLSGGCNGNFGAELKFWNMALDMIDPIMTEVKSLIPDVNIGVQAGFLVYVNGEINLKPLLQIPFSKCSRYPQISPVNHH